MLMVLSTGVSSIQAVQLSQLPLILEVGVLRTAVVAELAVVAASDPVRRRFSELHWSWWLTRWGVDLRITIPTAVAHTGPADGVSDAAGTESAGGPPADARPTAVGTAHAAALTAAAADRLFQHLRRHRVTGRARRRHQHRGHHRVVLRAVRDFWSLRLVSDEIETLSVREGVVQPPSLAQGSAEA